jgi:hypothetical protein
MAEELAASDLYLFLNDGWLAVGWSMRRRVEEVEGTVFPLDWIGWTTTSGFFFF